MDNDKIANAKIIILYLVNAAPGVNYHMLMSKCLDSMYMDFFTFSQAHNELSDGNLLSKNVVTTGCGPLASDNEERWFITPGGQAILSDIVGSLNASISRYLKTASSELINEMSIENSVRAYIETDNDGICHAKLTLNSTTSSTVETTLFQADVTVPDTDKGVKICNAWKRNASKIYEQFIENLEE